MLTAKESLKVQERFGYSVQEIDEIIKEVNDSKEIFMLAYDAISNGLVDEALLHLGIGLARLSKFNNKKDNNENE